MVVGGVHLGEDDLAHLAASAGDQDDPVAVGHGLRHHASGADGLVVGMGMDGHQGGAVVRRSFVRHGQPMLAQPVLLGGVRMGRRLVTLRP